MHRIFTTKVVFHFSFHFQCNSIMMFKDHFGSGVYPINTGYEMRIHPGWDSSPSQAIIHTNSQTLSHLEAFYCNVIYCEDNLEETHVQNCTEIVTCEVNYGSWSCEAALLLAMPQCCLKSNLLFKRLFPPTCVIRGRHSSILQFKLGNLAVVNTVRGK